MDHWSGCLVPSALSPHSKALVGGPSAELAQQAEELLLAWEERGSLSVGLSVLVEHDEKLGTASDKAKGQECILRTCSQHWLRPLENNP